jgi:hypothetical protein
MKKFSAICVVLLSLAVSVFAANDKITLEQNLSILGQETLNSMFGKGNFIVRVQVQMTQEKYSVKYTQQSNPKLNKKKGKAEQVYILPGVPALKNISPDNLNKLPFDSVTSMAQSKLKRMNVYVLVNKNFSKSKARKAEPILKEILGFKEGRDQLKFTYKPFYYNPSQNTQNITIVPGQEKLLSVQNIFYALILILLIVFMFIYIRYANKVDAKGAGGGSGAAPNISVNPNLELPKGAGGSSDKGELSISAMPKIKRYFDFVQDKNVDDFIYLMKKEKLNPDYIAMILSFIAPETAATILGTLSPGEKAAVASGLADQRLGSRPVLDKLETKIKNALECFVGGENSFKSIFEHITGADKKEMLKTLKKINPTAFKKVRPFIVLFDDLKSLEDEEIKLILSEANVDLVARALVSVDQELYQRVVDNLTKAANNMVTQFLELKSDSTSKKDSEAAQEYIIKVALSLDESGKIELRSKIGG